MHYKILQNLSDKSDETNKGFLGSGKLQKCLGECSKSRANGRKEGVKRAKS